MKKLFLFIAIISTLLFTAFPVWAVNYMWWAPSLTGGGNALDGIDGNNLTVDDGAIVITNTEQVYFYVLKASGAAEDPPSVIAPDSNPSSKRWHLISISSITDLDDLPGDTVDDDLVDASILGSGIDAAKIGGGTVSNTEFAYLNNVTSAIQTQLDGKIDESVIVAAGDVLVGTGAATPGVITKGANNTIFGVSNAGVLGFFNSFTPVWASAPASDDTYSGTITTLVAGETLAQWDTVYCKNKSGVHACYKYDRNGTDKAMPPRFMATAAINADASGVFLITGIVRNDGWSQTTNQDEGKIVYGSATAGAIDLTIPSTSGDMTAILGYVIEQNVIYFNPSPILVEVP